MNEYYSPMRWKMLDEIHEQFPYAMAVSKEHILRLSRDASYDGCSEPEILQPSTQSWLNENIGLENKKWAHHTWGGKVQSLHFLNEEDAMAFKLSF